MPFTVLLEDPKDQKYLCTVNNIASMLLLKFLDLLKFPNKIVFLVSHFSLQNLGCVFFYVFLHIIFWFPTGLSPLISFSYTLRLLLVCLSVTPFILFPALLYRQFFPPRLALPFLIYSNIYVSYIVKINTRKISVDQKRKLQSLCSKRSCQFFL